MNKLFFMGVVSVFLIILSSFAFAQNPPLCLETDAGYNIGQPGQMYYGEWVYDDYCMDSFNVHERYCVQGSWLPARGIQVYCPNGCKVNDVGLAGCADSEGNVPSDGRFYQLKDIVLPEGWKPAGSNPVIVPNDVQTSGSEEQGGSEEDPPLECDGQCEVPEFSSIAALFAISGAGFGYLMIRKRK